MQLILKRRLARLRQLASCTRGLALTEFAFSLPIVLTLGGMGIEFSCLAIANMRVSQWALDLANNASRIGENSSLAVPQVTETDLNDVLDATKLEGQNQQLTTFGRVTLSSLENQKGSDGTYVQRIHWQRCIGSKSGTGYDSTYGSTLATDGTDSSATTAGTLAASGMGDAGAQVTAPQGYGVMFVEVNYDYQPIFGSLFMNPRHLHYIASFIVRGERNYSFVSNPDGVIKSTCDKHGT